VLNTLSKEKIDNYIESMVDRITSKFSPVKIYLFGSYATEKFDIDSDIDLLIVVDAKDSEKIKEIRRGINKLLADREMPVDIIVISSEKMDQRKDVPGTLPYICIREGEILYEREG